MMRPSHVKNAVLLLIGVCFGMGLHSSYVYITARASFRSLYSFDNMISAKTQLQARYSKFSGEARSLAIARDIAKQGNPVLITVVNNAFLPLAHSWLCNTQFMNIHDIVMFIVPDMTTRMELERMWTDIYVIDVTELETSSREVKWASAGYERLMLYRTQFMNKLLMNNVDVFLFEVDAVWFRNPVYDIINRLGNKDIAAVPTITNRAKNILMGGLLYLRATNRTKAMWAELTKRMNELGERIKQKQDAIQIPEAEDMENDQGYLTKLVLVEKFADIQVTYLPEDVYADGKWYKNKEKNPNPILINNSRILGGLGRKIARAKRYKHWFWKETTKICVFSLPDPKGPVDL